MEARPASISRGPSPRPPPRTPTPARPRKELNDSEASAQEPASRPRRWRSRRLRCPGPDRVRLGRHHSGGGGAAAKPPATSSATARASCSPPAPPRRRTPWTSGCRPTRRPARTPRSTTSRPAPAPASPRSSRARPPSRAPTRRSSPTRSPSRKKVCKGGQAHQPADGRRPDRGRLQRPRRRRPGAGRPDAWRKIFDSKITKWNDPAIKKLNPGAKLPDPKIQAFHRSDESGTTDNFTKYLKAAAPAAWKHEPAKTWDGKGGQAASGSSGVASQVKQTSGAICYFELSYATAGKIPTAKLDTGAKAPVEATVGQRLQGDLRGQAGRQGRRPRPEAELHHQGRRRLPDHPGDVRDRLRQGQQDRDAGRHQVLPDLHRQQGRPERPQRRWATPRCPTEIADKVRTTVATIS